MTLIMGRTSHKGVNKVRTVVGGWLENRDGQWAVPTSKQGAYVFMLVLCHANYVFRAVPCRA